MICIEQCSSHRHTSPFTQLEILLFFLVLHIFLDYAVMFAFGGPFNIGDRLQWAFYDEGLHSKSHYEPDMTDSFGKQDAEQLTGDRRREENAHFPLKTSVFLVLTYLFPHLSPVSRITSPLKMLTASSFAASNKPS